MGFFGKLFGGGGNNEGQGKAAQLLSQLTSDLNLSADQLSKIKQAFQEFRQVRKTAKDSGEKMKDQMQGVKQELKTKIENLLSPEQKQKFMASMDKYKDFFHH
jgi:hypothetical protein